MPCGGAYPHVEITQRFQREWHAIGESNPSSHNEKCVSDADKQWLFATSPRACLQQPSGTRDHGMDRGGDRCVRCADRAALVGNQTWRPTALRDLGVKESDLDRALIRIGTRVQSKPLPPCAICYGAPGRERNASPEGSGVARHGSSPGEKNGYERALHSLRCDHRFTAAKERCRDRPAPSDAEQTVHRIGQTLPHRSCG